MILNIRNKWITLRGSTKVTDQNENDVYYVQGKFWTFTRKKFVQTMDKKLLYTVRNKFWTLFARKALIYDKDGKLVASIRRKIFSLHDHYDITCDLGKLTIRGNILGYDYHILLDDIEIGHVARNISLRDSFVLEINDRFDSAFFVALVIAIDNIVDQMRSDASAASSSN